MKKLTLAIVLMLLSLTMFSQDVYKVEAVSYLVWNGEEWVTEKTNDNPEGMYMVALSDKVKVTDNDKTIYYITGKSEKQVHETHETLTWKAFDEKGRDCKFMIKNIYNPAKTLVVVLYLTGDFFYGFEYILKSVEK